MNKLALGAMLGAVFACAVIAVSMPEQVRAGWFQAPCILTPLPNGTAYTYDVAAKMFDEALRHEGDGQDISALSQEDYDHAARDVWACKP